MSSSPIFTVRQKNDKQKKKMIAIQHKKNHTSSPRSRPNSRLEMLMIDIARSTEQRLESLAKAQPEKTRSQEESKQKLDGLARGQADLAYAQIGHVAELANIMGRISSVEKSLQGPP